MGHFQGGLSQDEVWLYPMQFHSIVLSLFSSLIAPFGGFFASGFKRAFKVKVSITLFESLCGVNGKDKISRLELKGMVQVFFLGVPNTKCPQWKSIT